MELDSLLALYTYVLSSLLLDLWRNIVASLPFSPRAIAESLYWFEPLKFLPKHGSHWSYLFRNSFVRIDLLFISVWPSLEWLCGSELELLSFIPLKRTLSSLWDPSLLPDLLKNSSFQVLSYFSHVLLIISPSRFQTERFTFAMLLPNLEFLWVFDIRIISDYSWLVKPLSLRKILPHRSLDTPRYHSLVTNPLLVIKISWPSLSNERKLRFHFVEIERCLR